MTRQQQHKNLHGLSYGYLRYALHQRTHTKSCVDIVINEFEVIIMIIFGIRNEHTLIILTLFYYERFLLLVIFDAFLCGFHIKSSIFANFFAGSCYFSPLVPLTRLFDIIFNQNHDVFAPIQ